ncbi:MAG TPA: hypothetical protein VFJ16_27830 [Longimicrobium sp.]|nr:hypothetical protein [Longimicrobium sp.]
MMKKLSLSPEELRVDSFSTQMLGAAHRRTVQGHVTRPECANTVYATCDTCDSIDICG